MKLKLLPALASLFMMAIILPSCMGNNENTIEYSSDASITAFSIGDIETVYPKVINGVDSTVAVTLKGKDYPFVIDQINHLIHNVDSLPYGTNVSAVVTSIIADTNYIVYTNNSTSKDTLWTSTDSINFESPVNFKVSSQGGTYGAIYKVSVNVHRIDPEAMVWSQLASNFPGNEIKKQKAVYFNNKIYVFADANDQVKVTSTDYSSGTKWSDLRELSLPDKADYNSVMAWANKLYILAGDKLYCSSDGLLWEAVKGAPSLSLLVSNYYKSEINKRIIAINKTGTKFIESSDGLSWNETTNVPVGFPKEYILYVSYNLPSNNNIQKMLVTGKSDVFDYAATWSRLSTESKWGDNAPSKEKYMLPRLENIAMIHYNDNIYAFGGDGSVNDTTYTAFSTFFMSQDHGINWQSLTEKILFPNVFNLYYNNANGNFSYAIDPNQYLWIMWSDRQYIWKGRINKQGFVIKH